MKTDSRSFDQLLFDFRVGAAQERLRSELNKCGGTKTFRFEGPTSTSIPGGGALAAWCRTLCRTSLASVQPDCTLMARSPLHRLDMEQVQAIIPGVVLQHADKHCATREFEPSTRKEHIMPVDISQRPYSIAELRHYSPDYFKSKIAHKIIGAAGINWKNATGQQSCAMRMSIALAWAGVHWPQVTNSWRLKDTNVYFPSYAGDYPTLLANPETILGAASISGRKGVIYFGGGFPGASGHVTLWNGSQCHFNDDHWDQPVKCFWPMA